MLADRDRGLIAGVLMGEGHFGGDGRQAQVTVRMHTRHGDLFQWLVAAVPGSRLYGPYSHGGRSYFQWMVRGSALRSLLAEVGDLLRTDGYTNVRCTDMCNRYGLPAPGADGGPGTGS